MTTCLLVPIHVFLHVHCPGQNEVLADSSRGQSVTGLGLASQHRSRCTHQVQILALHDLDVHEAALELATQHRVDLVLLTVLQIKRSSKGASALHRPE